MAGPLFRLLELFAVSLSSASRLSIPTDAELRPMTQGDLRAVIRLAREAMPSQTAMTVERAFGFHFDCASHGIEDGRRLFVLRDGDGLLGFSGLHHAPWSPPQNTWLSFTAVAPGHRGRGLGKLLVSGIMEKAREAGHSRLFLETYAGEAFAPARCLVESLGFVRVGGVETYLPDGAAMLVYHQHLHPHDSNHREPVDGNPAASGEACLVVP